jgi:hypothetical protein
MAESYRRLADNQSAITHYARIVREYPVSDSVKDAKKRLIELNSQVPEPDPLALNRSRQKPDQGGGLFSFGWLFGGSPGVSTETAAASVQSKTGGLSVEQGEQ